MSKSEVMVTGDKEIMRLARTKRGVTQTMLGERLNMKQNSLSANMGRQRVSLGMFVRILDALGYDVMVVDRETGSAEWQVKVEE